MQTHFIKQAEDILVHRVINSGSRHYAHQVTFYLIKWASKPSGEAMWGKEADL